MAGPGNVISAIGFRADTRDFKAGREDLQRFANAQKEVQREGKKTEDAIGGLGRALRALTSAFIIRETLELVDAYKNLTAQINLVTDSELERAHAIESLNRLAADNGQSIAALVNTYARLARSSEALGLSQQEVLRTTEALSNAIIASGATAQEASAGLTQLSQGLASGALRGDELRSVMEQLPRVATALASGLNVSLGQLRLLGEEGAITTGAVIAALESQFDAIKTEAEEIPDTFARAMERVRNSLILAFGESDAANAFSQSIISVINGIAEAIPQATEAFDDFRAAVRDSFGEVGADLADIGLIIGGIALTLGPTTAAIVGAAVALAKFADEIARGVTGTDDFILALRTVASLAKDAFGDLARDAKATVDGFVGVTQRIFAASQSLADSIGRALTSDRLYDAAGDFLEFLKRSFSEAASAIGADFAARFDAELKAAEQRRLRRANEIQLGDFRAALADVETLGRSIEALSDIARSSTIGEELKAQIDVALREVEKAREIRVGINLSENLDDARADARELDEIFKTLGVTIGESLGELDKAGRGEILLTLRDAIKSIGDQDLKGVLAGYVEQIEDIEAAAAAGEKALTEFARKPGESFSAFADRLKSMSGAVKEASKEAVAAYRDAFDKIVAQIGDLKAVAKAAALGGEDAIALAEQEAKIRVDGAELYRKALAAGVALTREASEELIRQREQLAALADFEANFGAKVVSDELSKIAEQLAAIEAGGRKELERVKDRQELEEEILRIRLKAQKAGLSESDTIVAELEAELLDAQRKKLEDEVDKLPDKGKDFVAIIDQGLNRAIGDFVDDLLSGGADFGDLIGAVVKDIARDILAGPNGLLTGLVNPQAETINLRDFFGDKDIAGELTKRFEKLFDGFARVLSNVSKDLGDTFAGLSQELSVAASGAVAGFTGFKLGSGLADFVNGRQGETGGKIGGGAGGGIGFALGGPVGAFIGSAIGGFLGDIFGGLFGRKTATGQFSFDKNAIEAVKDSKKDARNERRDEILTTAAEAIKALANVLDADFIANIALKVQAGKKSTVTSLIDETTGRVISTGTSAAGDVAGASDIALRQALAGLLEGGDSELRKLADALSAANVPAEKLVDSLAKIKSVLEIGKDPVSEFAQALETIDDVFRDAARASGNFTQAIKELAAAEKEALENLAGAFDRQIEDELRRVTNPVAADVFDLLKLQKERIDDAQAINKAIADAASRAAAIPAAVQQSFAGFNFGLFGARGIDDIFNPRSFTPAAAQTPAQQTATQTSLLTEAEERLAKVRALNTAEFIKLIENIADSPESLAAAQQAFVDFAEQIASQTDDIDAINEALRAASEGFRQAFDKSVLDDISELTNPVLFAFNQLIEKQAELENFARTVGGDLFAVQRRNALERRDFFKRLSEEERRELVGLGEVISDTFGRIGIVLQETFDLLDEQIDNGKELARAAREAGEAFRDAARSLSDVRQGLLDEFFPGSPDEQLRDLLTRFEDARVRALSGDREAGEDVGSIGEQIVALQRELSASSPAFFAQLKRVTDQIAQVEAFFDAQADEQFALADAIESDTDLLKQMRDLLASDDPTIPVLTQIRDGLSAGNVEARALFTELISLLTIQTAQQAHADKLFEQMAAQAIAASSISNITPFSPQLAPPAPAPIVNVASPAAAFQQAITQQTNTLSALLERQGSALNDLETEMAAMKKDIRALVAYITQNSARFVVQ